MWALLIGQGKGRELLILVLGLCVSHKVTVSGFMRVSWEGWFHFSVSGPETQLRSVLTETVVNRTEALFLRLFNADQNLIVPRAY